MATKQNKNLIIGIAVAAVVVIAIIVGVIVAKNGGKGNNGNSTDNGDTGQIENVEKKDLSNIDVTVGYGDYDVMFAQSKAIQNGETVGQVIRIDGIVSHPMSKYSIGQKGDNGQFIGTEFIIEGADESEYPNDGEHVVITGEVVEKEPLYFVIKTTPQYVETFRDVKVD